MGGSTGRLRFKVLPAGKVADAGRKQRFVREARAASALNHPNIVTIHDSGVGLAVNIGYIDTTTIASTSIMDLVQRSCVLT
jgi:serine/threonine protein kinase